MAKNTDIRPTNANIYFLPVEMRVPLKFGPETVTSVTCARIRLRVEDQAGETAEGWGETPLSAQWVWPSTLSFKERNAVLKDFTLKLASAWQTFDQSGHPMEIGHVFQEQVLPRLHKEFNSNRENSEPMPWLGALVMFPAFAKQIGIDPASVKFLNIEPAAKVSALATKKADVVFELYAGKPFMEKAIPADQLGAILWSDYGFNAYAHSIIARDDVIANNPSMVKKFLKAAYRGWDFTLKNPEEAIAILAEYHLLAETGDDRRHLNWGCPMKG